MNAATIFLSIIFSAIGYGLFSYGKRMGKPVFMITGVIEMAFGYFVGDPILTLIIGVILTIIPFAVKL